VLRRAASTFLAYCDRLMSSSVFNAQTPFQREVASRFGMRVMPTASSSMLSHQRKLVSALDFRTRPWSVPEGFAGNSACQPPAIKGFVRFWTFPAEHRTIPHV
jgi:hypothetical protein